MKTKSFTALQWITAHMNYFQAGKGVTVSLTTA